MKNDENEKYGDTVVTKGLFKKSIFQWTELFCITVKLNRQPAFLKKIFKKNWAFKKMFGQFGIPRNARGHILPKKVFLVWSVFVSKKGYFFLKLPFFTTKWPEGLPVFGPELPTGVNKNHVKDFCWETKLHSICIYCFN